MDMRIPPLSMEIGRMTVVCSKLLGRIRSVHYFRAINQSLRTYPESPSSAAPVSEPSAQRMQFPLTTLS